MPGRVSRSRGRGECAFYGDAVPSTPDVVAIETTETTGAAVGVTMDLSGTWLALPADDDLRRISTRQPLGRDGDGRSAADDAWEQVPVPGHWRSQPAFANNDDPLLYRTRFALIPSHSDTAFRRHWLTLHGCFYQSDVWLDGVYLGDAEGYFVPHRFEVSDQISARSEHSLVVEVACPPQTNRRTKRSLTGVFQHWDCIDPSWNPGGIWRPVDLSSSGPVAIARLRVLCTAASTDRAVIVLRTVLDATDPTTVEVVTRVGPIEHRFTQPLSGGDNRVEWQVVVPKPRLWWPHSLGAAHLVDVEVEVRDQTGALSDVRRRRIGLRSVRADDYIFHVNGERMFLKGANVGPARMAIADSTPEELRADIQLAKDVGLDLLRVHAHISRIELYEAADELGMLLWQDMPLQWGYARTVRPQAARQAREAVELLGHHPSVVVWCGHNEPLAMDVEQGKKAADMAFTFLALQGLPTWNKNVLDFAIHQALRRSDGTRPVIPHSGVLPGLTSGGTDSHFYFGWYHHDERELTKWLRRVPNFARFLSEFGAQAVPSTADFMDHDLRDWPNLDWAHIEEKHSLQRRYMDARIGPPDRHQNFAAWRAASQEYQARLLGHHITQLRRLKYSPTGGFALFSLADARDHPAVTWALFGHDRAPKSSADIVRRACAQLIAVADRLPAQLREGEKVSLAVHAVNDGRTAVDPVEVSLNVVDDQGRAVSVHPFGWRGAVGRDAVARLGRANFVVPAGARTISVTPYLVGVDWVGVTDTSPVQR